VLIDFENVGLPVVYWLGHLTSVQTVAGLNPARNPLLASKAVDCQPSNRSLELKSDVNCPMIALRGQPAGSRVLMLLNYSRCVVLDSEPA